MTPDDIRKTIEEAVGKSIDAKVNGKIDRLSEKIDQHNAKHEEDLVEIKEHMAETRPIIEAYKGFNTAGNLVKWMAGVGTAIGVLWIMIRSLWQ